MSGTARELTIGDWVLDTELCELRSGEKSVRLEPKVGEVLARLAQQPGRVVSREELLSAVWPGVVVGDDALTQTVIKLRRILGDDAHNAKYIETLSKRGYRLIAPVGRSARGSVGVGRGFSLIAAGFVVAVAIGLAAAKFPLSALPWPIGTDARGVATALPVVAVLPLANLSGDAKREYFTDGITEDIIVGLGRFSGVRVISRNSVLPFKGNHPPLATIREQLGARYIVQGTVRESAGRFRVAIELTDTEKGVQLWSDRFEGEGSELFAIQDRVVRNVVGALHVKLTELEKQRAFGKPTENLEAYDLALRARELVGRMDRRSNREARQLLARAAELAPDFEEIRIIQGEAELQRGLFGWVEDPLEPFKRAEALANQALSSRDTRMHSRAHYLMSRVHSNYARPELALMHAEKAVAANAGDPMAMFWHGVSLLYAGKPEEGIAAMEAARRLDPLLTEGNGVNLVVGYYTVGRYRDVLTLCDELIARYPRDVSLVSMRAASLAQLGEMEKAGEAAAHVRRLNPAFDIQFTGARFANPEHRTRLQDGLRKAGL
jgi:adenylate cyclase